MTKISRMRRFAKDKKKHVHVVYMLYTVVYIVALKCAQKVSSHTN